MNWLDSILAKEKRAHLGFFGREFDLSKFETTLRKYGQDKINEWSKLLLEPHFLPNVEISRKAKFPGFRVRPSDHSYEAVYRGKVLRMINGKLTQDLKAHWLLGQAVLIDTRLKPAYQSGRQTWSDDNLLGPIIEKLRGQKKLPPCQYGPQSSRFQVSDLDWDEQVRLQFSKKLDLAVSNLRLGRAVEGVVVPQIYTHMPRKDDGATDTWVWYEEFFEDRSRRVDGGYSSCGGLADVYRNYSGDRWSHVSLRPLAVL